MKYILENIQSNTGIKKSYFPYFNKWVKEASNITKPDINKWLQDMNYEKANFEVVLESIYNNKNAKLTRDKQQFLDEIFDVYEKNLEKVKTDIEKANAFDITIVILPFVINLQTELMDLQLSQKNMELIQAAFCEKLIGLIIKAHILELEKFEKKIQYKYVDEQHSKAEYINFVKSYLYRPAKLKKFFEAYPLMVDYFYDYLANFTNFIKEIDSNLQTEGFDGYQLLAIGAGDTHQKSRSVVKFRQNDCIHYYKPKNLMIENMFYNILKLYNEKTDFHFVIPNASTCYREHYTIQQEVSFRELDEVADFTNYYEELGGLLFIVYMLNGNDMHYENIIAHGEHPVIVDLETLFQASFSFLNENTQLMAKGHNYQLAAVGILHFMMNGALKDIDLSGLSGDEQELKNQLILQNISTMELAFDYESITMASANNIPQHNSKKPDIEMYYKDVIAGFKRAYTVFLENQSELLEIVHNQTNAIARTLTRATNVYARFLAYSNHPTYYTNLLRREKFFENILSYPFKNKKIAMSEVADLVTQDIPVFFHKINEKTLLNSNYEAICEVYEKTPLEYVVEKFEHLTQNYEEVLFDLQVSVYEKHDKIKTLVEDEIEEITFHTLAERVAQLLNQDITFDLVGDQAYTYTPMYHSLEGGKFALWLLLDMYMKFYADKQEIPEEIRAVHAKVKNELKDLDIDSFVSLGNQDFIDSLLIFYFVLYQEDKAESIYRIVKLLNHKSDNDIFSETVEDILTKKLNKDIKSVWELKEDDEVIFKFSTQDYISLSQRKSYSFYHGLTGLALRLMFEAFPNYAQDEE